jgi:hypothetical protein
MLKTVGTETIKKNPKLMKRFDVHMTTSDID